jgi:hypothetical protein
VVLKLGTVVVHDSIRTMIDRDRQRRALSTLESSGYRPRAPHPLLMSYRQAAVVMVSKDETSVILEDDFMSSITLHDEDGACHTTAAPLHTSSSILPRIRK